MRELGTKLGIPEHLVWRHPFPGPALGIRILGEVNEAQLRIAREADKIFLDEITGAGLYRNISQAFAALLPIHAVGVQGDQRSYEQCIVLRAVVTTDFMTATAYPFEWQFVRNVSTRIVNEVRGVSRVFFDGE